MKSDNLFPSRVIRTSTINNQPYILNSSQVDGLILRDTILNYITADETSLLMIVPSSTVDLVGTEANFVNENKVKENEYLIT